MQRVITRQELYGSKGYTQSMQKFLNTQGFDCGTPDGIPGRGTANAVYRYQLSKGLNADGVAGHNTLNKMVEDGASLTKKIHQTESSCPKYNNREELSVIYGSPLESSFETEWLTLVDFRKELQFDYTDVIPTKRIYMHKHMKTPFIKALKHLKTVSPNKCLINTYDGCWCVRAIRGGTKYSIHSWGLAFDIDASTNALGQKQVNLNPYVAQAFLGRGFVWGAQWTRKDNMHFQWLGTQYLNADNALEYIEKSKL